MSLWLCRDLEHWAGETYANCIELLLLKLRGRAWRCARDSRGVWWVDAPFEAFIYSSLPQDLSGIKEHQQKDFRTETCSARLSSCGWSVVGIRFLKMFFSILFLPTITVQNPFCLPQQRSNYSHLEITDTREIPLPVMPVKHLRDWGGYGNLSNSAGAAFGLCEGGSRGAAPRHQSLAMVDGPWLQVLHEEPCRKMISRARQAGPKEITAAAVAGFRIFENHGKRLLQGTVLFPCIYIYQPLCELSITTCSAHSVRDLSFFDAVWCGDRNGVTWSHGRTFPSLAAMVVRLQEHQALWVLVQHYMEQNHCETIDRTLRQYPQ